MIFDLGSESSGGRDSGKINGVMVGIVTDNRDPENLARVKLKLPVREDENQTDWVRIATLMAGKDMGSLFIPEVGDEVLVAFHLGEIEEPYVIGTLWSKKNPGPKPADKNDVRKIKTRSGHEIIFDDASDGSVTLKTKKGQTITLDDKGETVKIEESGGNNSIEIAGKAAGKVTVKSGQSTIVMDTKGDIKIESKKSVSIKSTQIKIDATASLDMKATGSVKIESSGILTLKGSMVKIN